MDKVVVREVLQALADQKLTVNEADSQLKDAGFVDLEFAKVDTDRAKRTGYPEIIYGAGKTASEIIGIVELMLEQATPVLITRIDGDKAELVQHAFPKLVYHQRAQILSTDAPTNLVGKIAIVTAGTSDIAVAEEAAVTAQNFGNQVIRIYDVGVAGIHRLLARVDEIRTAQVVIVIAGMEGALASVVGGLVDKPVIAVPTSIGYGANFGGVSALLTMLNSCASGITVVNIDNGFGAAYSASMINQMGAVK
ncbi:nickel pincer cofactor biosynthesis protein LarB [Weissella muntiaci]|uniref:Nickel pincer cofactor biosynthesis protein LarB n=1 Tax=Weissella muntiaci TaxID=2508881 RepID=A0A6C2C982_9LACO|nr:nickel pincer cofactor biosynthesis protein LarB [Weissella muntiaci]TYC49725.1 nickel pincer cofactor biosynthesis protein LarB [Weissella muntiaci]